VQRLHRQQQIQLLAHELQEVDLIVAIERRRQIVSAYFLALDIVAATDMLIPVPPPLLRSCVAAGKLIEIPLTKPLVPLRVGLYTRADSPPLPATKAATQIIVAIARRFAASGELRTAAP